MEYRYRPQGVCSSEMVFDIDGEIVKKVQIVGGCAGNTVGLSRLIEGLTIDEVIKKLKGIPCGHKGTSCPDQITKALEDYKNNK